jgi:hypothetical protein
LNFEKPLNLPRKEGASEEAGRKELPSSPVINDCTFNYINLIFMKMHA